MVPAELPPKPARPREECTLEKVKQALLAVGPALEQAEAVGIIGSLLREDFNERSDIDLLIVMDDETYRQRPAVEWRRHWRSVFGPALAKYRRDLSCILYPVISLRKVSNWYVLVVASDAVLVHDRGNVAPLFQRIIDAAHNAGLVKIKRGVHTVWRSATPLKFGQLIKVEVEDDDEPRGSTQPIAGCGVGASESTQPVRPE